MLNKFSYYFARYKKNNKFNIFSRIYYLKKYDFFTLDDKRTLFRFFNKKLINIAYNKFKKKNKVNNLCNYVFSQYNKIQHNNLSNFFLKWKIKFNLLAQHVFPIIGMRIEMSGTAKKGRRTHTTFYRTWVPDYTLLGKAANSTVALNVEYFQSYANLFTSSLGLKVWITFSTPSYTRERKRYDIY